MRVIIVAAILLFIFVSTPLNKNLAADAIIYGCVNKNTKILRIISEPSKCDNATGDLISWNQTGPAGLQGPQGPAGPQGPQGIAGPAGQQGPKGAKGARGNAGSAGPQGPQGAAGAKGDRGAKGDTGPQGQPGIVGVPSFYTNECNNGGDPSMSVNYCYCNSGDSAIGGGGQCATAFNQFYFPVRGQIVGSQPDGDSGWHVDCEGSGDATSVVWVRCVHVTQSQ